MCCGRSSPGPNVIQNPANPLPAIDPNTPIIAGSLILLRYIGTTPALDLVGVPTHARYRLRDDKTVTVNANDVAYLMAKVDAANVGVFERLS